eukprot:TRINITY_DN19556_c0_g2_i1.p1 TRINITY_DN19556_c0_g2~~TRINITY_DN19556_c0_g2_i1.p1  ORF type:complete len:419 (+),score=137.95 TRINITY_DN19556_c0_g2_i1:77-1333(+)
MAALLAEGSASSGSGDGDSVLGTAIVVGGGILAGLYTTWMGRARGEWENKWLQYSAWGMLIFPWTFVVATVDHLSDVLSGAKGGAIAAAVGFGFMWGWGSVLFGTAVSMVGDSLTFTIVLGLTAALGSVLPLVIQHTSDVATDKGAYNFGGLAAVLLGIALTAIAGRQRERDFADCPDDCDDDSRPFVTGSPEPPARRATVGASSYSRTSQTSSVTASFTGRRPVNGDVKAPGAGAGAAAGDFRKGLAVCLLSGMLSPCLNFALSFGKDVTDRAEDLGTEKALAGNLTLALTVASGFLANALACLLRLHRYDSWGLFFRDRGEERVTARGAATTVLVTATMGAMWFFGTALYNIGAQKLGDLGTVLGWPLFMDGMILTANISGVVRGEWSGTSRRARAYMGLSLAVLLGAVVIIGAAG